METLGLNIKFSKWEKYNLLPIYIISNYQIEKVDINGVKCLALSLKGELPTLSAIKKLIRRINEIENLPVFIQLNSLSNFRKENLLKNNIPFVLKDKMVYLPFMATFLTNKEYLNKTSSEKLTISAQLLLIWILYQDGNNFCVSDALKVIKFSNMSLTRAYRQLVSTGLFVECKKGRKIYLYIECSKLELIKHIKSYLRNPILHNAYMMKSNITTDMVYSGESALSYYGFINPPSIPVYAVCKNDIENIELQDEFLLNEEQVKIEIWDYNPKLFSNDSCYVDILSLIISLLNTNDERIEMEIDKLLDDFLKK